MMWWWWLVLGVPPALPRSLGKSCSARVSWSTLAKLRLGRGMGLAPWDSWRLSEYPSFTC
eukprot:10910137-Karenia_brevis.AAC.1